jgi:hypothetical protein
MMNLTFLAVNFLADTSVSAIAMGYPSYLSFE